MKNVRIVLADDHEIILDGIQTMLAHDNHFTVNNVFKNTTDCLTYFEKKADEVDLLITDIHIPVISGIALCQMIKQNYPRTKVLILSMYGSKDIVSEAMLAEADGYMLKNEGRDALINAIHKIMDDGTYFSSELIPILYQRFTTEKKQKEAIIELTPRENDVLLLIAKELTSEEIGEQLHISVKTVGHHRQSLLAKCKCKSSVGLAKYAIRSGLIKP